jgi:hypothetical protein
MEFVLNIRSTLLSYSNFVCFGPARRSSWRCFGAAAHPVFWHRVLVVVGAAHSLSSPRGPHYGRGVSSFPSCITHRVLAMEVGGRELPVHYGALRPWLRAPGPLCS